MKIGIIWMAMENVRMKNMMVWEHSKETEKATWEELCLIRMTTNITKKMFSSLLLCVRNWSHVRLANMLFVWIDNEMYDIYMLFSFFLSCVCVAMLPLWNMVLRFFPSRLFVMLVCMFQFFCNWWIWMTFTRIPDEKNIKLKNCSAT